MNPFSSESPKRKLLPYLGSLVGIVAILTVLILVNQPQAVTASSGNLSQAVSKYPAINGTKLDSCDLCHTSNVPSLNAYGSAFKSAGRNTAAFAAIEAQDSDGDGFSNIQEIKALSFPGDKSDHPAAAPTAVPTQAPTKAPTTAPSAVPTKPAPTSAPTNPAPQPTATQPGPKPTDVPAPTQPAPQPTVPAVEPTDQPEPPPAAGSQVFKPVADAYVNKDQAKDNFGSNRSIRLDASPEMRSYLRFEITGLDSRAVQKAILKIYANSSSDKGFSVRAVSDTNWDEGKITFASAPKMGKVIAKSNQVDNGHWVSIDVTDLLKGSDSGKISLALTTEDKTQINLAARESGSHAPQLIVQVSGAGNNPPTTPAPTKTPPASPAPTEPGPTPTQPAAQPTQPGPQPTTGSAPTQPGPQPTNPPAPTQPAPTQPPASGKDPIIFFNGDLVSSSSLARAQSVVALIKNLMGQHAGTPMLVASTGDNEQESAPTLANYQKNFGATYQTFVDQGIFKQIRGNHDIQDSGHGAAYAQYFGANAHLDKNGQTNYSYDLGAWHFVGLEQLNGSVNANALAFLKSDLAAHPNQCTLVYWHVPTYSSGSAHGDSTGLKALNQAEYDAGVDIQVNGHDHDYQRFYPLNPSGVRDDARGITTFIDGIGGEDGRSGSKNSVAQSASAKYLDSFPGTGSNTHAIGAIQFTLHAGSADYALYDANNNAVLDQGSVTCHKSGSSAPAPTQIAPTQPAPTAAPTQTGPTNTPAPTQPGPQPTTAPAPTTPPLVGADPQPSFPIRAAFYYPWFPEGWNQQGFNPFTNYHPTLGYYSAADLATVQKQIGMMQYGGMQAGIASWWGQGSSTDVKIPNLLKAAAGTPFRWSLYYENESTGNPSAAQITSDLTYMRDHYAKDPSFLRVNGKFVVFVYSDTSDGCGMADRWKQGNTVGAYIVLKVFAGYAQCASQPDSWHQYSPAVATDTQGAYSSVVSPGFWKKGDAVRLARNPQQWASNVNAWAKAAVKWQLVTTFNEWGEGTSVEPAQEWASASGYGTYLDALHAATTGGIQSPAPTQPAPTQPPAATPKPSQPAPTQPAPTQPAPTAAPTTPPASGSGGPTGVSGTWNLKFSDEFNGSSVDTSKWQPNWLGGSNTAVTKPINGSEQSCYDPAQATVVNGSLKLSAVSRSCNGYSYASGMVTSHGHYTFTYGYMEARVWMDGSSSPKNWPAFWADGTGNWPTTGEIDVMEGLGGSPAWHYHWGSSSNPSQTGGAPSMSSKTGWHIFGADWEAGSIKFYYDGKQVGSATSGVVGNPMYLILNYAVSSSISGPIQVPSDFLVDYVRVWQH
jgi:beta-glucanase (GH16 family)